MKVLHSVIFAVVFALNLGTVSVAMAAEPNSVSEQQPSSTKVDSKEGISSTKTKMKMMIGFTCDRKRCACTGIDDCSDLGGTGLCKGPVKDGQCTRK